MKLETMARNKSILRTMACNEFAVLVRVTAPQQCTQRLRIGVDLIVVLDISAECGDNWLEKMKQAMVFVIDNLGPDDRLSIVTFNSQVHQCTKLNVMSNVSREEARTKVLELKVGKGHHVGAALQEAAKILGQRGPEEKTSRLGRIILVVVSKGKDVASFSEHMSHEYPIDVFGFGNYNLLSARTIADQTSGVYSHVVQDIDTALAQCIGGLTSVTAMGVEINLQTAKGVTISSIDAGDYKAAINPDDRRSGTIFVHDLYAGEKKNFIVWLSIPEGTKAVMGVSGCYRNPKISKEATIELDSSVMAVLRPMATTSSDDDVCPEVAAELVRLRLLRCVSDMKQKQRYCLDKLQEFSDTITSSQDWRAAPESDMLGISNDVEDMKQGFYNRNPVPFMCSWMSSHLLQRANIKGSPSKSGAFRTTAMEDMLRRLYYPQFEDGGYTSE